METVMEEDLDYEYDPIIEADSDEKQNSDARQQEDQNNAADEDTKCDERIPLSKDGYTASWCQESSDDDEDDNIIITAIRFPNSWRRSSCNKCWITVTTPSCRFRAIADIRRTTTTRRKTPRLYTEFGRTTSS